MDEQNLFTLEFASQNIPIPFESRNTSDNTYVTYGLNNQYPTFILDLYKGSAIHSAIINQKTTYIIGDGLKKEDKSDLDLEINANDNIKQFASKIIKDYLLFGSFV